MDPALILALFERLTGYPLDSQGRSVLHPTTGLPTNRHGSYGIRFPTPNAAVSRGGLSTDNPSSLRLWSRGVSQNVYTPVPVYMEGTDARAYENVWPCVTFVESDIIPETGADPYIYDDPIGFFQGTATIDNPVTDYTLSGNGELVTRRHPESFVQMFTIRAFSKDPIELAWIVRSILYTLKKKGAISVENADGTFRMVDYYLDRVAYFDQGEMFNPKTGVGPTEDRYLSRAFTYMFETHLDNSVQGFGTLDWSDPVPTITQRIMELSATQDRIWEGRIDLESHRP